MSVRHEMAARLIELSMKRQVLSDLALYVDRRLIDYSWKNHVPLEAEENHQRLKQFGVVSWQQILAWGQKLEYAKQSKDIQESGQAQKKIHQWTQEWTHSLLEQSGASSWQRMLVLGQKLEQCLAAMQF